VISVDIELALVGLAAMAEPATLLSSSMALVVSERPLRTGAWFYLGGVSATMVVGVLAAFLVGNKAASNTSEPKTWVSIVTLCFGVLLLAYVVRLLRKPPDPKAAERNAERIGKVASARPLAVVAAGAVLANPGVFMLVAAKSISQLDPSTTQYLLDWLLFTLVAFLPLGIALLLLLVAPGSTKPRLAVARAWVERYERAIIAIILMGLAGALMRDGIAGLTA
jgi:Sap, sulfolipid-1-addressing protein